MFHPAFCKHVHTAFADRFEIETKQKYGNAKIADEWRTKESEEQNLALSRTQRSWPFIKASKFSAFLQSSSLKKPCDREGEVHRTKERRARVRRSQISSPTRSCFPFGQTQTWASAKGQTHAAAEARPPADERFVGEEKSTSYYVTPSKFNCTT